MVMPWAPGVASAPPAQRWNTPSVDDPPSGIKVWDGKAWRLCPVRVWDGTAWRVCPLKYWDGTGWRLSGW